MRAGMTASHRLVSGKCLYRMGRDWLRPLPSLVRQHITKGVSVKRSALVLAAAFAVAACQDGSTAPQARDLNTAQDRFSNPPPPPIELGALATFTASTSFAQFNTAALIPECEGFVAPSNGIVLPVKYMYNPAGNSGFLHFEDSPDSYLDADANGMIRMQDGDFTGKGVVTFVFQGCPLVIHLDSVNDLASQFAACGTFSEEIDTEITAERDEFGCFSLTFDRVTLGGEEIGGAQLEDVPPCVENDTRPACNPILDDDEIIVL